MNPVPRIWVGEEEEKKKKYLVWNVSCNYRIFKELLALNWKTMNNGYGEFNFLTGFSLWETTAAA